MVFGWGKKKQESDEVPQKSITQSKLRVQDIDPILGEQKETSKKKIVTMAKPLFSEMQSELGAIYKIIDHLKNDSLKVDDIDKTLKVLVVRSKTEVIDTVTKESKNSLPPVSTYDDVVKTAEIASRTLKKIGDVLGKNSRVIHVFAKKYAEDLKSHLELVTKNNITITKLLSDFSSLESSSDMIREKISKIQDTSQEISDTVTHIEKLEATQTTAQEIADSTQKQISEMHSSAEHEQFLKLQAELHQIKSEESKADREIDDEFSKVSRPLGKYVYVTSLDKSLKSILERLVERPSQTLASESRDSVVTILESCMKGIMSGTVSVKEADKSVDQITHLISILDGLVSKKNAILAKTRDIEQKIKIFDVAKLEALKKQLAKAQSDEQDSQEKIKNLKAELEQKTAKKKKLLQDLEISLEKLVNTKYEIVE